MSRQVYFANHGYELIPEITSSYIEKLLIKELRIAYPEVVKYTSKDDGISGLLESEFFDAAENFEDIYANKLTNASSESVENTRSTVYNHLGTIASNLNLAISYYEKDDLLEHITPFKTEPILNSDKLKLSGSPDILGLVNETPVKTIIKTGKYPDNGVWNTNRLHISALTILAEKEYGCTVDSGFVLYARYVVIRKVKIRTNDRRQIFKILNRVKRIKRGVMPDKKESQLCNHCNFSKMCSNTNIRDSLASKFF
ncbi:MAG: Dna2/Cas4 domain-containing protein [Methanohalobium sp.]|uniref:Dna2/Cas4 domain-containing protein n=1 Tax=Methanohalobium sp. TaxID=2837493 RepID=UPI00397DCAC4